jgi:prolyl oligopeptidase
MSRLFCAVLPLLWCGAAAAQMPAAPRADVVDTYFGTPVADPYRPLEKTADPAVAAWMKAMAAQAEATLARIAGRDALRARLQQLDAARSALVGQVSRTPSGWWVYERRDAHENAFRIVARRGLAGPERTLVDPAERERATGTPHAVNYFSLAPDGRHLAYGISAGGSEQAVLHVIEVPSGRPVGEPISHAELGSLGWSVDGRTLFFNRLDPNAAPATKYERSAAWALPVGAPFAQARELVGPHTRRFAVRPSETPQVRMTADGRWLLALLEDGVRNEIRVAIAPASQLGREPAWRVIVETADEVTDVAYGAGRLYALTHRNAPRSRIVAAPVERFRAASAATVVPAGERILNAIVAARDGLYFDAREGNAKQLWKLPFGANAKPRRIALPLAGTFRLHGGGWRAADPALPGALIALEDWTHATQWLEVRADGTLRNTRLQPRGPDDAPADIETTEVLVPSHDGERVPLSIIHRKGLALDGNAPTLLTGYGAYGSTVEPRFVVHRLAWIEHGGVIAVANPRGSGVFGQAWYEAGKLARKPNTWKDMVACAEVLVARGYTKPARLAIEGRSAGGIAAGRAATERPELFVALVPQVGVLDMLRAELEPNGPPNIPEFGTHTTEPGFRALLAMSTYHQIRDGVTYPAVLLTHGVNDPRVAVWHSSKTAARFIEASTSGRPVLLRLDYAAGHGVGSTREQWQGERADIYAFLLWQMGVPGFQLKKETP